MTVASAAVLAFTVGCLLGRWVGWHLGYSAALDYAVAVMRGERDGDRLLRPAASPKVRAS